LTSVFMYLFTLIALLCSPNLRKSVPMNYIVLGLFTLSMAFMFAGITAWLTVKSVLISIGTLAITLICLFGAALIIPAKPKVVIGIAIGVFAACML